VLYVFYILYYIILYYIILYYTILSYIILFYSTLYYTYKYYILYIYQYNNNPIHIYSLYTHTVDTSTSDFLSSIRYPKPNGHPAGCQELSLDEADAAEKGAVFEGRALESMASGGRFGIWGFP
jgi:hypothetical protein